MEFFWHFCGFSIQPFFMKKKKIQQTLLQAVPWNSVTEEAAWGMFVCVTEQLIRSHSCCSRVSTSKDSTEWKLKTREQGRQLIPNTVCKMGKQKDKLPTELGLVLIQQSFPLEFFYHTVLYLQFGRWKCRELRMWLLWDSAFVVQSGSKSGLLLDLTGL